MGGCMSSITDVYSPRTTFDAHAYEALKSAVPSANFVRLDALN